MAKGSCVKQINVDLLWLKAKMRGYRGLTPQGPLGCCLSSEGSVEHWNNPSKPNLARINFVTREELDPNLVPREFDIREERWCLCGAEDAEGQRVGGEVLREMMAGEPFSTCLVFLLGTIRNDSKMRS